MHLIEDMGTEYTGNKRWVPAVDKGFEEIRQEGSCVGGNELTHRH